MFRDRGVLLTLATLTLVVSVAVGDTCIHDSDTIQRPLASPHLHQVEPQRYHPKFHPQAVGSIRFALSTDDLYDASNYCALASGSCADMLGGTATCDSDVQLTTAKRDILLNDVMPYVTARLSAAIQVDRIAGNLVVPSTTCGQHTVPASHTSTGVANADMVLYLSAAPTTGSTIAWASYCFLDNNNRPIGGRINFSPKYLVWATSADQEQIITTATHEILHALGFSQNFMNNYFVGNPTVISTATIRGKTDGKRVVTANVVAKGKAQFGCTTLPGVELEEQSPSHWERRNTYEEVMSPVSGKGYLSALTLAFLQDSGHYTVDYGVAEAMGWGKDAGCSFVDTTCTSASPHFGKYWCGPDATTDACTYDRTGFGTCQIRTFASDLDAHFQYFSDPKVGGSSRYMDYCGIIRPYSNRVCNDTSHTPTVSETNYGFVFSGGSRCIQSSTDFQQSGFGTTSGFRCLEARCPQATRIQLRAAEGDWHDCPDDGSAGTISITGYTGTVTCPQASDLCADATLHYFRTATKSPSPSNEHTMSASPTLTASGPSRSMSDEDTQTASVTESPSKSHSPSDEFTQSRSTTITATGSLPRTRSLTTIPTKTATVTTTATPTNGRTATLTFSASKTMTLTATLPIPPTRSETAIATRTETQTATTTASYTHTVSATKTGSATPTVPLPRTPSTLSITLSMGTPSPSGGTETATRTPSGNTATVTASPTASRTGVPTATVTLPLTATLTSTQTGRTATRTLTATGGTLSPSSTKTVTATLTPPMTTSSTKTVTATLTRTVTASRFTPSLSLSLHAESPTKLATPSVSLTRTQTVSASVSFGTMTVTNSGTGTRTATISATLPRTPSTSYTPAPTPTATISTTPTGRTVTLSATGATRTITGSATVSPTATIGTMTSSATVTRTETGSRSASLSGETVTRSGGTPTTTRTISATSSDSGATVTLSKGTPSTSLTASRSPTDTETMTATLSESFGTRSLSESKGTLTLSESRTLSGATLSFTASTSFSLSPTLTLTLTDSASLSKSTTDSLSETSSDSPSATSSPSSSSSDTVTESGSGSSSASESDSLSVTPSLTPPPTPSPTRSKSLSRSVSQSLSFSFSSSKTTTPSLSFSNSPSKSASLSFSRTRSLTASTSLSKSFSDNTESLFRVSPSNTTSLSISISIGTKTKSLPPTRTRSLTRSASLSVPPTPTMTFSTSPTWSASLSISSSGSPSASVSRPTRSASLSESLSITLTSVTPDLPITASASDTWTQTRSISASGSKSGTGTRSVTVPPTASLTLSVSRSKSDSRSSSSSHSTSLSRSSSRSQSTTITGSTSRSVSSSKSTSTTASITRSASGTPSVSRSESDDTPTESATSVQSESPSQTIGETISATITPPPTPTESFTISPPPTRSQTFSLSFSYSRSVSPPPTASQSASLVTSISESVSAGSLSPSDTALLSSSLSPTLTLSGSLELSESLSMADLKIIWPLVGVAAIDSAAAASSASSSSDGRDFHALQQGGIASGFIPTLYANAIRKGIPATERMLVFRLHGDSFAAERQNGIEMLSCLTFSTSGGPTLDRHRGKIFQKAAISANLTYLTLRLGDDASFNIGSPETFQIGFSALCFLSRRLPQVTTFNVMLSPGGTATDPPTPIVSEQVETGSSAATSVAVAGTTATVSSAASPGYLSRQVNMLSVAECRGLESSLTFFEHPTGVSLPIGSGESERATAAIHRFLGALVMDTVIAAGVALLHCAAVLFAFGKDNDDSDSELSFVRALTSSVVGSGEDRTRRLAGWRRAITLVGFPGRSVFILLFFPTVLKCATFLFFTASSGVVIGTALAAILPWVAVMFAACFLVVGPMFRSVYSKRRRIDSPWYYDELSGKGLTGADALVPEFSTNDDDMFQELEERTQWSSTIGASESQTPFRATDGKGMTPHSQNRKNRIQEVALVARRRVMLESRSSNKARGRRYGGALATTFDRNDEASRAFFRAKHEMKLHNSGSIFRFYYNFLIPRGRWFDRSNVNVFLACFGKVFEDYHGNAYYAILEEIICAAACGIADGYATAQGSCLEVAYCMLVIALLHCVFLIVKRPFTVVGNNVFFTMIALVQLALAAIAVVHLQRGQGADALNAAIILALVVQYILLAKALIDIGEFIHAAVTARKAKASGEPERDDEIYFEFFQSVDEQPDKSQSAFDPTPQRSSHSSPRHTQRSLSYSPHNYESTHRNGEDDDQFGGAHPDVAPEFGDALGRPPPAPFHLLPGPRLEVPTLQRTEAVPQQPSYHHHDHVRASYMENPSVFQHDHETEWALPPTANDDGGPVVPHLEGGDLQLPATHNGGASASPSRRREMMMGTLTKDALSRLGQASPIDDMRNDETENPGMLAVQHAASARTETSLVLDLMDQMDERPVAPPLPIVDEPHIEATAAGNDAGAPSAASYSTSEDDVDLF